MHCCHDNLQVLKMSETRVLFISGYLGVVGNLCSYGTEIFDLGLPTTRAGPTLHQSIAKFMASVAISDSQAVIYGGQTCGNDLTKAETYLIDLDLNVTTLVAASTVNGPRYRQSLIINLNFRTL